MICKNCGNSIPDNSNFCSICGFPVRQDTCAQEQSVNAGQNANMYQEQSRNTQGMQQEKQRNKARIEEKPAAIISYITWIGWIVAFFAGDRKNKLVYFHLNQALVLHLASLILSIISQAVAYTIARQALVEGLFKYTVISTSIFGGLITILRIVVFIAWIAAFISAIQGKETEIPVLKDIHILK